MAESEKRPLLISILAILIFGIGIFCLVSGTLFAMGRLDDYVVDLNMPKEEAALISIGLGTAQVAMAGGFWDGWKLAWYIGILVMVLLIVSNSIIAITSSLAFLLEIPLDALILLYLLRPGVKEYFKHRCLHPALHPAGPSADPYHPA